jgi:hypothetical protein
MNIAVLCPGRSVINFTPHWRDYQTRICVNRSVQAFACDWWCACDNRVVETFAPVPTSRPRLFTIHECHFRLGKHGYLHLYPDLLTVEELWEQYNFPRNIPYVVHDDGVVRDGPWMNKSTPSAIALAAHLGATRIDLWGADMDGCGDWDGFEYNFPNAESERACHTRTRERWDAERRLLDGITEYLKGRGCELRRMT